MLVLGLVVGAATLGVLAVLGRPMWVRWRRAEAQACVSEEEARENAAPLTTAIVSRTNDRKDSELVDGAAAERQ